MISVLLILCLLVFFGFYFTIDFYFTISCEKVQSNIENSRGEL